ncbi:acetyltransferase (GNAT) domain protein [Lachnoanaerobaculum saburreum F0468]|jgi:acetyltransferase, GNAT family|uniref:Acetyltransferase (GNAT) domain protein n=1 Tax=Lachnoanaerobaculum saburreum F0468 TaxID=1095750 RepID=I0R5C8_9FIRM|nr:GNAT family N-acetyltransferase [Lachnoanaerobaculum saburreum]EIC94886.1 acetyltransferase (GNAT) domain protein [Lachnoanaerobaculum saburreum F0468]
MNYIRQATIDDLVRIAEIFVFNYRLNFYPIFQEDTFYFEELTVFNMVESFAKELDSIWVYDDGVVKGFIQIEKQEVRRLFVEPILQGKSIGADLLEYGIAEKDVNSLWVLEKNIKAIVFYKRHGFYTTNEKKYEEDTIEFLVRMER